MSKTVPRDKDGLTAQEARAALLNVCGYSQTAAVEEVYQRGAGSRDALTRRASKLFAQPRVRARVTKLVMDAKLESMMSPGQWFDGIRTDLDNAREAMNFNAVANLNRLIGQALGVLQNNISMTIEQRGSDTDLIAAVSKDGTLQAGLVKALGAADGFEDSPVLASGKTKH